MSSDSQIELIESHLYNKKEPERIEKFAREVIQNIGTNKGIKKAIKRGEILVDENKIGTEHWMKTGQTLYLYRLKSTRSVYEFPLNVCYEDDNLAVIFKPPGLSIHNNQLKNLINALPFNLQKSETNDALSTPHPIHRLDQQTAGLVIVAKSRSAQKGLSEQLRNHLIKKYYTAIVHGKIEQKGEINTPIEGLESVTHFESLQPFKKLELEFTLVRLQAVTGRTHQLRIHLSQMGHPIVGDRLYGDPKRTVKGRGLMLCANELQFIIPDTGKEVNIQSDLPKKFEKFEKF